MARKHWVALSAVSWLFVLTIALCAQFRYDSIPSLASLSKKGWPAASKISRSTTENTLVMFLHPHCPCSRASLHQVTTLKTNNRSLNCVFLFYTPSSFEKGWEKTDIWRTASEIPGAHLVSDRDGVEAKNFGALTSGQTYIFDKQGSLRYEGGLTEGRGHEGGCRNLEAAMKVLTDGGASTAFGAVYGCPIVDTRNTQL